MAVAGESEANVSVVCWEIIWHGSAVCDLATANSFNSHFSLMNNIRHARITYIFQPVLLRLYFHLPQGWMPFATFLESFSSFLKTWPHRLNLLFCSTVTVKCDTLVFCVLFISTVAIMLPVMLWCYWFGIRKGICHVRYVTVTSCKMSLLLSIGNNRAVLTCFWGPGPAELMGAPPSPFPFPPLPFPFLSPPYPLLPSP